MKQKKKGFGTIILIIMFVLGFLILLYPIVSNWLATRRGIEAADTYKAMTSSLSQEELEEEWNKAVTYNEHLRGDPVKDPFLEGSGRALPGNYQEVLNIDGVMGYVEVPSIDVKLPIYHGVEEEVLQKGIGHIESTALPIGGLGAHPVLTGHTGLPTAKLFTDLIDVEVGDYFYIHVLGKMLIYEVDQITVIDPKDISELVPFEDKDYVTLLTCTPYGINSHRLLVRGERSYKYSEKVYLHRNLWWYKIIFWISAGLCIIFLLVLIVKVIKRNRGHKGGK